MRKIVVLITALGLSALTACQTQSNNMIVTAWKQNQQMILVLSSGWNAYQGILLQFEYKEHRWIHIDRPFNVSLGQNGAAWGVGNKFVVNKGGIKTEGDMRSPAGIFHIGTSFGYANLINSHYPFKVFTKDDYCVDNSKSRYYNQIVSLQNTPLDQPNDSSEPMRRDLHLKGDQLYKLGFVLEYNIKNIPKAGSCIFVHLRKDNASTTAGCTAMDEKNMRKLLHWLNYNQNPVFVLLPINAYKEKQKKWNLPEINWISSGGKTSFK